MTMIIIIVYLGEYSMKKKMNKKSISKASIKDYLHDLENDISLIKDFRDFEEDKPFLLGWINSIRLLLGLEEK